MFAQFPQPIRLPTQQQQLQEAGRGDEFITPEMESGMDGTLVTIKHQKKNRKHRINNNKDDAIVTNNEDNPYNRVNDKFATELNWATDLNPDGVGIVQDAMDQGTCGSCWASSAIGSLEASVARREAFRAYNEYWDSSSIHDNVVSVPVKSLDEGIAFARHVEQSTFQSLNLSIQELLDCDTAVDQGCTGGNPLLAFHFIHQYGLVRSEQYSYSGDQHVCNVKLTNDPVATVTAWGILPVDSEAQMELAIRHIGPISVGVNGADPTFLSYDGGIFSLPHCKQGANHALLIVGYGEELDAESTGNTTTVTRFWIARNSWGRGWGENGFVRIQRNDGRKGTPGQCGIARSPSVALGGVLLQKRQGAKAEDAIGDKKHKPEPNGPERSVVEPLESTSTTATSTSATISSTTVFTPQACQRLGRVLSLSCDRFATWQATHVVLFFGGVALLASLAVVWPLTRDCRHRERRRRLRRLATATLARAAENLSLDNETGSKSHGTMNREDESSSLLVARKASDVLPYGTMDRME